MNPSISAPSPLEAFDLARCEALYRRQAETRLAWLATPADLDALLAALRNVGSGEISERADLCGSRVGWLDGRGGGRGRSYAYVGELSGVALYRAPDDQEPSRFEWLTEHAAARSIARVQEACARLRAHAEACILRELAEIDRLLASWEADRIADAEKHTPGQVIGDVNTPLVVRRADVEETVTVHVPGLYEFVKWLRAAEAA